MAGNVYSRYTNPTVRAFEERMAALEGAEQAVATWEEDVYLSAQLACLEMIKSGTTSFADSGGRHMHKVAEAVIEESAAA